MTEIQDGQYLYCLVRLAEADAVEEFSTAGIEDELVSVHPVGEIGAVVHTCDSLYDSDDPQTIQQWLLAHQRVVDEAGELFGTPIPFQFDTVLTGGDEALSEWIESAADRFETELAALAGHWEYRIEVTHHETAHEEIVQDDPKLSTLRAKVEAADSGTAYLLEKQYDKQLADRLREHRRQQARRVADRIAGHVSALESLGSRQTRGVDLDVGQESHEPIARFAVLATDEGVEGLGDELDEIAAEPGVEVRFTGPWPPYTFAPEIDTTGGDRRGADSRR